MKTTLEDLKNRRSCRTYRPEQITEEELEQVLQAGMYAPTGSGKQSPRIVAIQNAEVIGRLKKMNAALLGNPEADPFYGAPTVVVVLADRSCPTYLYDGSCVMDNLMNAAEAVGLGSCWIQGRLRQAEDGRTTEAFCRERLALPEDWALEAILSLGIPAESPPPHTLEEADWGKVTFL